MFTPEEFLEASPPVDCEPTASDLALEAFRKHFPLTRVNVWPEGNGMTYSIHRKDVASDFKRDAERVIRLFNLPLVATTHKLLIGATLVIEYKRST